ncbi:MAG TPA: tyrosine--tRNA ligase [Planctomycetota bacterium]|nr:tyrosine--tRNA ligase [Planctomycetota bacterium]
MKDPRDSFEILRRGTVDLVTAEEFRRRLASGRRLRVKFGWDPTGPEVHLGHCVVLRKLRAFQDLGHAAVLIIGDGTAMVGDPTGRQKSRPPLSTEEIDRNLSRYLEQAGKVVDLREAEVVRNGEWFHAMTFADTIRLAARGTVARMLERDYFQERMKRGDPVGIHELLYPLMQGLDSVQVRSDVELGATEQLFNLLVGRDLQAEEGQEPQVCLTLPILEGTDGRKMSKTYGNSIGILEAPREMFGKVMSIPDRLLPSWFSLLTDLPEEEIAGLLAPGRNPRDAKARLASEIVAQFHGSKEAGEAAEEFDRVFAQGGLPSEIPELVVDRPRIGVLELLLRTKCAPSTSEARRLVAGKGVRVDGSVVDSIDREIALPEQGVLLNVGKRRFMRILPRRGT